MSDDIANAYKDAKDWYGEAHGKPTHTPGPWTAAAGPSSVVGWPVVSKTGRSICRITWRQTVGTAEEVEKEETRANARLIAAAPDLLDALQGLFGLLQLILTRTDLPHDVREVLTSNHRVQAADAALARAGRRQ